MKVRSVGIRLTTSIVFTATVLSGCAFHTALPLVPFKSDSGPKVVRVSLFGNAPDIILSRPALSGDSIVGATQTPLLAVQVRTHVLRADSIGRLAIPVTDIRGMVAEPSGPSAASAATVIGLLLVAGFVWFGVALGEAAQSLHSHH